MMGTLERWVRAMAGLPSHNGYRIHAESDIPEGVSLGSSWKGGRVAPEVWTPETDGDLERPKGQENDASGSFLYCRDGPFTPAMVTRGTTFDAEGIATDAETTEWDGDALAVTAGFAEDMWHVLTTELSWTKLLVMEVAAEVLLVLGFTVMLYAAAAAARGDAAAEEDGALSGGDLFMSKLLLAFSTVRISSDAIFGWNARDESSAVEVSLVALLGWMHWLLLSLMSSLIVARALKPQQQLAFAPDCVVGLNTWAGQRILELSVRCMVLRPWYLKSLQNVELKLSMNVGGVITTLPLKGGISGIPFIANTRLPIVLRHVVDESSPIVHMIRGGLGNMTVLAHIGAEDMSGHRMSQAVAYLHCESPLVAKRFAQGFAAQKILFGAKYRDQIRFHFKRGMRGGMDAMTDTFPIMAISPANFHKIIPDPESLVELDALARRVAEAKQARAS